MEKEDNDIFLDDEDMFNFTEKIDKEYMIKEQEKIKKLIKDLSQ